VYPLDELELLLLLLQPIHRRRCGQHRYGKNLHDFHDFLHRATKF